MRKWFFICMAFGLFATSIAPFALATTNATGQGVGKVAASPIAAKTPDYRKYAGKWGAKNYKKKTYYQGDYFETGSFFTLKFISPTKAKFSIMSISTPPDLEIADYSGTVTFKNNKASFIVKNDGFMNQGRGTITLAGTSIKIQYKTTKMDPSANWDLSATGTYRRIK